MKIPHPPRTAPKVDRANEARVVWEFVDAGYGLTRDGQGKIWLVKDEHRVPVLPAVGLFFELRHLLRQ